jgi:imidazolonepropionase-like amidohydrolase
VIDVDGRTLMPGIIDCHWHSVMVIVPLAKLLQSDIRYMTIVGSQANRDALMRGFTTLRDVGGNVFAIKQATDEGLIAGPRLCPSGATISQTSGHGDFRGPNDVPALGAGHLFYLEVAGMTSIADGVPEVTKATREVLRKGAAQIKAMAGGGVTSTYDPIDVTQYTFEEMKAIVDVTKTWHAYVCVHAFTPEAVRQAIEAGVMSIEVGLHGAGQEERCVTPGILRRVQEDLR